MPFYVYVIRLRAEALKESAVARANPQHIPFKPCVYVGSSWHPPEVRYQRHIDPASKVGSKWVRRYHLGLHKRLTELQPTYDTREEAEKAERELARRLRKRGYAVMQG